MNDNDKKNLEKLENDGKKFNELGQQMSKFWLGILIFGIVVVISVLVL